MRAVVPPVATWPAPGVARPLDGAVVGVVPEGVVVGGVVVTGAAVVGAAVVGVCAAVVGAAEVAGVCPPIGGWVSGTLAAVVGAAALVVEPPTVGASVVDGEAVVVLVVSSPLRTTTVAMPAPRAPRISRISAMVRSRLREFLRRWLRCRLPPERLCRVGHPQTWTLRWPSTPRGCSSTVEPRPSKAITRVRLPSPAL